MDSHRFDELTRAMSAGTSRRRALKLLAGAVGGALFGARGAASAAQDCRRLGRRCDGSRPCCAGLACFEGVCVPAVVERVAACVPPYGACGAGQTCCPGASCAGGVCCPVTLACGDQCCANGTLCLDGSCATPGGALLCPSGQRLCGAAGCRDLQNDPSNCGSCGNACAAGQTCRDGACSAPGCPGGVVCSAPRSCEAPGGSASTEGICCKAGEWAFACCRTDTTFTGCCDPSSTDPSKICPGFAGGPLCRMAAASTCDVP